MPRALLLSPDDQAVSAITGVLEEMSVTCERPLDGASAAQKLNSRGFDLVLVDCENLPAAKLIFDVCRRGKNGNNPVPIAIVDGHAGLPTAFRLGAELILTKPVAKDQARSTIRTAVSRVRKEVPASESVPAQPASAAMPSAAVTEERSQAAAISSQLTSFAEPGPSFVPAATPTSVSVAASAATLSAPALTLKVHSAEDEIDATQATPNLNPQSGSFSASSFSETSSDRTASLSPKPPRPARPSDDPVLAELEGTELEESQLESSELDKPAANQPAAASGAPIFSSHQRGQQKRQRHGPLVALLMLVLVSAGFYAAWTYQPGFRAIAQPQIDRVLALAGMALPPAPAPNPAKPPAQMAPATTLSPAPGSPIDSNKTPSTIPESATGSATGSMTSSPITSATPAAPVRPSTTPGTAVAPPISRAVTAAAPLAGKAEVSKPSESTKGTPGATSDAQLPGESNTIILSSKGAEKRLAHSVPPKYPAEARDTQGTVVLKAVIDEDGKVDDLRLVEGNATLSAAAIQAVKQWRYRPYVRDGKALPFQTIIIVDFQRP